MGAGSFAITLTVEMSHGRLTTDGLAVCWERLCAFHCQSPWQVAEYAGRVGLSLGGEQPHFSTFLG